MIRKFFWRTQETYFLPEIENLEMLFRRHYQKLKLRRLAGNVIDVKVVKDELSL